ncbi:hypothetical protein [Rhodococcus sp. SORGH_AS_0303]|nr:hypothetical protein [Rhodococcus sp. SORGH_AS_0303]MDQ1202723.1 hypothetical protein [Rhodococcus sp. SORGH_AS_0303]
MTAQTLDASARPTFTRPLRRPPVFYVDPATRPVVSCPRTGRPARVLVRF